MSVHDDITVRLRDITYLAENAIAGEAADEIDRLRDMNAILVTACETWESAYENYYARHEAERKVRKQLAEVMHAASDDCAFDDSAISWNDVYAALRASDALDKETH